MLETGERGYAVDIVGYLHRRTLRHEALLCPAMRELAGASFRRIHC